MVQFLDIYMEDNIGSNLLSGHVTRMLALMNELEIQNQHVMSDLDSFRHEVIDALYTKPEKSFFISSFKKDEDVQATALNFFNGCNISLDTLRKIQILDKKSKSLMREMIALENQVLNMVKYEKDKTVQNYNKMIQHTNISNSTNNTIQTNLKSDTNSNSLNTNVTSSVISQSLKHNRNDINSCRSIKSDSCSDLQVQKTTSIPYLLPSLEYNNQNNQKINISTSSIISFSSTYEGPSSEVSSPHHDRPSKKQKKYKTVSLTNSSINTTNDQSNSIHNNSTSTNNTLPSNKNLTHNLNSYNNRHQGMRISVASTREIDKKQSSFSYIGTSTQVAKSDPVILKQFSTINNNNSQNIDIERPTWNIATSQIEENESEFIAEEDLWDGICPICQKGESETQHMMVGCDACNNWFHFECVNYNASGSEDAAWFCPQCIADRIVPYPVGIDENKMRGMRRY